MVSLSRDSTRGGGIFLGDNSVNFEPDSQQLHPVAMGTETESFKPLHTVAVVAFQLIVAISIFITGVIMALSWPKDKEKCEPYFILMYVHAVFWCISLVVDHHLKLKHETLRLNGYLDFYKLTHCHFRIPFHIVSLWNAVILVVGTIFHQAYANFEEKCKETGFFTPLNYLVAIIAVEVLALAPFLGSYIVKVSKFNKSRPSPDAMQEDLMESFHDDNTDGKENVFSNRNVEELLERQADLIRFLRDHNAKLGQKIVSLNAQLHGQRNA